MESKNKTKNSKLIRKLIKLQLYELILRFFRWSLTLELVKLVEIYTN
jgi:hypothetical protein